MRIVSSQPSDTARRPEPGGPARIAALAVLPVFLDLHGRPALVIGGSAGAAWKAELLAAAGAAVAVLAPTLSEEMEALLARGAPAGSLRHMARAWQAADLPGAAVAVADIAGDEEAAALADAARAAGVPLNVIDRPEFCAFQFGSIVNRSPVVIGISTDGAAPILGQAVRQRIEGLLPPALAQWAALAQRMRARVMATLPTVSARRRLWERLAARAFGPPPAAGEEDALLAALPTPAAGRVTLVGAGPGDAGLLTLNAVRALQAADVILFDDLVSEQVLELARREARRMMVGKRAGRPSCAQQDIHDLMLTLARAGRHVVRLKSGDPMVFGRAGEEIAALRAEGITVEVVPGITAALALAASLGVSLTHRDTAQQVRFVTGHGKEGSLPPGLDWRGLADPATTTVIYMGARFAPRIAARLIAEGLDAATPVIVAAALSTPAETRLGGRLADLAEGRLCGEGAGGALPDGAPVLIGVGRVFADARVGTADHAPPAALAVS